MSTVSRGARVTMERGSSWFRDYVRDDVLGNNTPEDAAALRADVNLDAFYEELRELAANLHAQLTDANGRDDVDEDWRRRTKHLKTLTDARLVEIRPKAKELRRQINHRQNVERAHAYRKAIRDHRDATAMAEVEPSERDLALWAMLDGEDES